MEIMTVFKSFSLTITKLLMASAALILFIYPAAAQYNEKPSDAPGPEGAVPRPLYDFSGDNRTDFTQLQIGASGTPILWKVLRNEETTTPTVRYFFYGVSGDTITVADFIGSAKSDVSIRRGTLFYDSIFNDGADPSGTQYTNWGISTDNYGRDGDYDGDGKDDHTALRIVSNNLQWYIKGSTGVNKVIFFGSIVAGQSTFAFQGADYTGDGRDEIITAQVTNATGAVNWFIGDANTGAMLAAFPWGNFNTDILINPADYTGDGRADILVWAAGRPGADQAFWFIRNSATGTLVPAVKFGIGDPTFVNNDLAVRGDYDGDGRDDIAVYRPSNFHWYWIKSSTGLPAAVEWGDPNDVPLPNFFTF